MLQKSIPEKEIGVITPYKAQEKLIRRKLNMPSIEVGTVDGFQVLIMPKTHTHTHTHHTGTLTPHRHTHHTLQTHTHSHIPHTHAHTHCMSYYHMHTAHCTLTSTHSHTPHSLTQTPTNHTFNPTSTPCNEHVYACAGASGCVCMLEGG